MTLLTAIVIVGYLVLAFALAPKPLPKKKATERGIASYYSDELAGKPMANGEKYNPDELVCASWHYSFGTKLRVTNISNGKSVVVTCKDRGPNKRLGRLIDLSLGAFRKIADIKDGLISVQVIVEK